MIVRHRLALKDLRFECAAFEARYGVPTDRLEDAFDQPCLDDDATRWSMLRAALRCAEKRGVS